VDEPSSLGLNEQGRLMVTYGSAAATIRVNRAADAALAWAAGSSVSFASFAAKPKHQTMPTASTGVAMN
jgi:hypothetical protein